MRDLSKRSVSTFPMMIFIVFLAEIDHRRSPTVPWSSEENFRNERRKSPTDVEIKKKESRQKGISSQMRKANNERCVSPTEAVAQMLNVSKRKSGVEANLFQIDQKFQSAGLAMRRLPSITPRTRLAWHCASAFGENALKTSFF